MLFIRDKIPSRLLKPGNLPSNFESIFVEINLCNKKWLMCCSYNPKKSLINNLHMISVKYWILLLVIIIISLLLEVWSLKLLKVQCINSAIAIICTVYVINILAIKIWKNHHVLIFF